MSEHTTPTDRTVHASFGHLEIVRYDRAGKWYVEGEPKRSPVSMLRAAHLARSWRGIGGKVFFGLPGGKKFDAAVRDA